MEWAFCNTTAFPGMLRMERLVALTARPGEVAADSAADATPVVRVSPSDQSRRRHGHCQLGDWG